MDTYSRVLRRAEKLQEDKKLTTYEALDLSCKLESIETMKMAFLQPDDIYDTNAKPTALEAIGMALGFKPGGMSRYSLDKISDSLDTIAESLQEIKNKE